MDPPAALASRNRSGHVGPCGAGVHDSKLSGIMRAGPSPWPEEEAPLLPQKEKIAPASPVLKISPAAPAPEADRSRTPEVKSVKALFSSMPLRGTD